MLLALLPLDIYKIIYRYIYDCVLNQFKRSFGRCRGLVLKTVPRRIICNRVKHDSCVYDNDRYWLFRWTHQKNTPSDTRPTRWAPDWNAYGSDWANAS